MAPFSSKPVVCVCAPFPPPMGGMSVQADKLAARLTREGVQVLRVQSFPQPPRALYFVRRIPGARTLTRGVQYLISVFRAMPRADIIHHLVGTGLSFFMHAAPLLILCPWWKKRLVLNYRSGNAGQNFMRRWGWLAVPLMKRADCIAVPSAFLQRVFREYGLESVILPNIADTELFPFRERRQFAPRLIVARHLTPTYDIGCVVRAFAIVQAHYPDATLGIAGTGNESARIRRLVEELNLRNVDFLGQVPNTKMPAIYANYDIAVNASISDNFPGALLEAALSGLAVVSSDAGGIPDMIRQGETGLLVPKRDPSALAAAVLDVVQKHQAAHHRTLAARQWAEQYSWENVRCKLLVCYSRPVWSEAVPAHS